MNLRFPWRWIRRQLSRLATGQRGEQLAAQYLRRQGYRILARNLRFRFGEIDLLAMAPDGLTVVVVEVKASRSENPLLP
ncbi:MAG: YraN family protein, partial [Phycisphaeraceae bacterium]|nr:YraN family protein [Phycisphaeraceae bacterium]